jgi:hypothetical protein
MKITEEHIMQFGLFTLSVKALLPPKLLTHVRTKAHRKSLDKKAFTLRAATRVRIRQAEKWNQSTTPKQVAAED